MAQAITKAAHHALIVFACMALATAAAHMSCLLLGVKCFKAQLAPPAIIESAQAGTWLAPVSTLLVSAIFVIMAAYALARAGVVRKLPCLTPAIYLIYLACIVRGVIGIQWVIRKHQQLDDYSTIVLASVLWLIAGLLLMFGQHATPKHQLKSHKAP